jgi:hypothetical protein
LDYVCPFPGEARGHLLVGDNGGDGDTEPPQLSGEQRGVSDGSAATK